LSKLLFIKLAPFWILALIIGSLLPHAAKVAMGTSPPPGQPITMQIAWTHRLVHYAAFGSTALLLFVIARNARERQAALLATIALGVGIETLQHVIYKSSFETLDACDDAFAACAVSVTRSLVRRTTGNLIRT
jgi:hypothetical protein